MNAFNYIFLVFDKLQCDTQTHSNYLTKYVVILKGTGHSKLEILSSVLVTIDLRGKVIETGMKSMPVRSNKKKFVDPKRLRALAACDYIMSVGVGLKEKEKNGGRGRERDLQRTHWQIWSVCSAGLFLAEEMGKSHAGTLQTKEKITIWLIAF